MRCFVRIFGKMRVLCAALLLAGAPVAAQDLSALARLDAAQSGVVDEGRGVALTLYLSQAVPYRVFTLTAPERLVMDFREVDWRGADAVAMDRADGVLALRFGPLRPGWSRLVMDLGGPLGLSEAGMRVSEVDGTAVVRVLLEPVSAEAFAAAAGAPQDPAWDIRAEVVAAPALPVPDGPLIVAIDPGHGGIDPGAEREGLVEAHLMLQLAMELAEAIARVEGMEPMLTRDGDYFVPLDARMTRARAAGANVFLSLHADALEEDEAAGLSIYTLSEDAADGASLRMAERHEAGDLLAGVDLSGTDDTVATVLMDLARLETGPASDRLADTLVIALRDAGVRLNSRPRRSGPLAVLTAPDIPSALIELGFLSNAGDRARLADPARRAEIIAGLVQGLRRWAASEEIRAPLIRQ